METPKRSVDDLQLDVDSPATFMVTTFSPTEIQDMSTKDSTELRVSGVNLAAVKHTFVLDESGVRRELCASSGLGPEGLCITLKVPPCPTPPALFFVILHDGDKSWIPVGPILHKPVD